MKRWWKALDAILRGEATRPQNLRKGTIDVPVFGLSTVLLILAMVYGACLGCFALLKSGGPEIRQIVATTLKVPALFGLTLVVTLPSLYVFNAIVGSRLSLMAVVKLLASSLAIILAVLASLGPIVAFFAVSTTSYSFMVLLNVLAFGAAGLMGMVFLLQTLQRLSQSLRQPTIIEEIEGESAEKFEPAEIVPGALDPTENQVLSKHVKLVFRCWVVIFGLVGSQMGWVLRPFVGNPHQQFVWFRGRESNFFQGVWHAVMGLFS